MKPWPLRGGATYFLDHPVSTVFFAATSLKASNTRGIDVSTFIRSCCKKNLPLRIHGTGIFTYMNGWFLLW